MPSSDTLSPSCLCLLYTAHSNTHSVTCCSVPPCFELPGITRTAFESLCFLSPRFALLSLCVCRLFQIGVIFKFSSAILLNFTLLHCTVKRILVPWVCGCNYCSLIAFQPFSRFLCSSPNPSHKCKLQYLKRSSMCLIFLLPSLFFLYFCTFHCSTLLLRMYDFHTWAVSVGWTQVKPA